MSLLPAICGAALLQGQCSGFLTRPVRTGFNSTYLVHDHRLLCSMILRFQQDKVYIWKREQPDTDLEATLLAIDFAVTHWIHLCATFCNPKWEWIQGYPNDAATCWPSDSVRFLLETFTYTIPWKFFGIVIETLILRAFQNLPIPIQVSSQTRQW